MTDVRLTATNPEDSSVVPVACNERGELLLEEPTLASDDYVAVTGDTMTGNLLLADKITFDATSGGAEFKGPVEINTATANSLTVQYTGTNSNADAFAIFKDAEKLFRVRGSGRVQLGENAGTNDPSFLFAGNSFSISDKDSATNPNIKFDGSDGSAEFAGITQIGGNAYGGLEKGIVLFPSGCVDACREYDDEAAIRIWRQGDDTHNCEIRADGKASFSGDVIVGSRNTRWMLVESNGLCHMVQQTRATTADLVDPSADDVGYPPLRDVFAELDAIEKALGDVMEKLRMNPPAGWEVWDGSNEGTDRA